MNNNLKFEDKFIKKIFKTENMGEKATYFKSFKYEFTTLFFHNIILALNNL